MDNIQTALLIAAILCLIYIGAWVLEFIRWRIAKYGKVKHSAVKRPAGAKCFTHDYKKRIREQGRELRRITRGKGIREREW